MPRKRHDTSDDDSDNNVKKKSKKSKKSSASSDKKQKDTASSKPRKVSESSSDSSPLKGRKTDGKRVKGQKRLDSESDTSPVKKGVQSRVERPGDKSKSRRGRQDSRDGGSADRPVAAEDVSPDRRKRRVPERSPDDPRYAPEPRQGRNVRGGLRSASPEPQRRSLDRFPIDSFDAHDYRVRPVEFDRRERDDFIRDRYQDDRVRQMQYGMLDRGDFRDDYRDRPLRLDDRDRFDPRERAFRREPISPERGFPMRRMDSFSPDRMRMRNDPAAFQFDRRRSGSFEQDGRFQRRLSLSPLRRNERRRLDSDDRFNNSADADRPRRPLSPVRAGRRQMDRRSPSPDNSRFRKSASIEMAKSPVRQNKLEKSFEENKSPEPKTKSGKSGKKKKSSKNDKNDNDTKSSNKSKDEKRERSESLERSFERSKQSLIIPEEDLATKPESKKKSDTGKENKKSGKKNAAKRQRSASGSPPRAKKSKDDTEEVVQVTDKKTKKKEKKEKTSKAKNRASRSRSKSVDSLTLTSKKKNIKEKKDVEKTLKEKETKSARKSRSRSPSPQERSLNRSKSAEKSSKEKETKSSRKSRSRSPSPQERSLNRSKSSDVSFDRKHDMAQFESEPESGEITDSEEEGKNALKSQVTVNKPLDEAEEKKQAEEDEKYWNEKRKNSKKREEDITKQPSSKSGRDDVKKDQSGKRGRSNEDKSADTPVETEPPAKKPKPAGIEVLTGRTGGAYIPPAKLRAMQASITDKSSVEYQRISWEALKKSINGLVNKVNVSNIENIVRELFQENIVRGRGLFGRSIIQAQSASPTFTHVYAALVSIVNTKFPQNGELVLRRLIIQFRRGYKRNDKTICLSATRFVAHLVNQQVAHEVLALEVLTLLLEEPTDDSVEVAIGFLKECGQKLTDVSPRGINAIFERLRHILHESQIDKRVQYMIEVMFAVRKDQFKDYPALVEELDLVEEEDQFTHLLTLEDAANGEELLNVFRPDPSFQENEEKYKILKKEILGEGSSDEEGSDGSGDDDDDDDSSEEEQEEEDEEKKQTVIDQTETNMVALRRTIYLTIQSSLDFEECAHKLMKMDLKPGQEIELCNMILDCCAQMRTYEKFFGLLAGRFCVIDKKYVEPFQNMFKEQYDTIHRLETNKLRNVAKFFSHLLFTDSISWAVLFSIKLNEEDTTSASRIFIKILFQELSEYMGLPKLNERLKDPTLSEYFVGLMPRDNPRDTRFAINFFTTIGLGGLTDDLREHLKDVSKKLMQQKQEEQQKAAEKEESSDSSDSDSSSGSESDSESDSSSDSDSSEDEKTKKRKKKEAEKQKNKDKDKRKDKGKEKNDAQREKQKDKIKDKQREKDRGKDKERGRDKERSRDRERNNQVKNRKDKKGKKKQLSEAEIQKEKEKNFKRLARLANYDEEIIDPKLIRPGSDRESRSRKSQENGDRRERRRNVDDREFDRDQRFSDGDHGDFDDDRIMRSRERGRDSDMYLDRSLERSYDSGYEREERFDGGEKRRRGKRSKDNVELDRNDPSIRVERNFERMDIYEDKFVRDRARNIEYLRSQPEFEDYYEGRSEDRRSRGGEREGRRKEVEVDDPSFDARLYRDKGGSESRRRNRSEERVPVSREGGRRRR